MLKGLSKKDFYIGQRFYYLVHKGNRNTTTQPVSEIREIKVEKIGSKYVYFSTAERYEYGSDHCYLLKNTRFHGPQWERVISESQLFDNKTSLEDDIYRMELINKISKVWEVKQVLKRLSVSTLERIELDLEEIG